MHQLGLACGALDVDILGLQEVDRRRLRSRWCDQSALAARQLGACRVYGPALRRGLIGAYGNALVVRGVIDESVTVGLPDTGQRDRRIAILARVRVRELHVSVAVTHLQNLPSRRPELDDEAPAQLEAVLDHLAALPRPRLLLGDLNLQPPRAEPILAAAGYQVATAGPTFPADSPRLRLDYIAVDGFDVVETTVGSRAPVSDHRPLIAELRSQRSLP